MDEWWTMPDLGTPGVIVSGKSFDTMVFFFFLLVQTPCSGQLRMSIPGSLTVLQVSPRIRVDLFLWIASFVLCGTLMVGSCVLLLSKSFAKGILSTEKRFMPTWSFSKCGSLRRQRHLLQLLTSVSFLEIHKRTPNQAVSSLKLSLTKTCNRFHQSSPTRAQSTPHHHP